MLLGPSFRLVSFREPRPLGDVNLRWQRVSTLFAAGMLGIPLQADERKLFHEIWEEEVPVMGHLAVAMDGTVLVFKEERERKRVEVKRSEDGGRTWSDPIVVGERVPIGADMSDDGRYKGEHVGWSELGSVVVDEMSGEIMVFARSEEHPAD